MRTKNILQFLLIEFLNKLKNLHHIWHGTWNLNPNSQSLKQTVPSLFKGLTCLGTGNGLESHSSINGCFCY